MGTLAGTTDFLSLLTRSGLIDAATLDRYLAGNNLPPDADVAQLAGGLVRDGLLTRYQAEQLLQGKWRGFFIGRYKVLGMLGEGGMGKVFLCEHAGMRRQVAIKVLPPKQAEDPAVVERFIREAQAIAALDHRNIVHAYDVAQDGPLHYLVMEYVKGCTLDSLVARSGPLSANRVLDYLRQSAQGLHHAVEAGLVHRDIKPSNLLVAENGVVKILDLGLARFFHDGNSQFEGEGNGSVMGTVDYMAPEQALDSAAVDNRADIYSLGATFYFCLTGRSPFEGGTTAQKLLWHQVREPEPLQKLRPELPEELTAIISKMMAKDPALRFQTPDELLAALPVPEAESVELAPQAFVDTGLDLLGDSPTAKQSRKAAPATAEPGRRAPRLLIVAGVLSLLAGAAAAVYFLDRPDPDHAGEAPPEPSPKPAPQVRPTPQPAAPRPTYLSDFEEAEVSVGHGNFGKRGSLGYDNRRISVRGISRPQGLSMHPPTNGSSHVAYDIGGRYRTFSGSVAVNDTGAGKTAVGLTFTAKGDGKLLWESKPTRTRDDEQVFAIDVTGVHRLQLEVRCPGKNEHAQAVWCDPRLYRVQVPPEELLTARPIDPEGYIRLWLVLGPIPHPGGVNVGQAVDRGLVPSEAGLEPKEGEKVKVGNKELAWSSVQSDDFCVHLDSLIGRAGNSTAYMVAYIVSAAPVKDAFMWIGSDDSARVYLNGSELGKVVVSRGIAKDQDLFTGVALKQGVNVVVFKVSNGGGDWKGAARFVDRNGTPIRGLTAQLTK